MDPNDKRYVVVVGIDYSESSELALERALDIGGEKPNAEVHVVHVLSPLLSGYTPEAAPFADPELEQRSQEQLRAHVERALARRSARSASTPARVVTHVRLDAPAAEVAQLASDLEADLVVVGTHGRRGVSRLLLGSIAEGAVRLAPCPVLVVREKASPEPIPQIEPPCPRCVEVRKASEGREFWCAQHAERHGQRHTYHQGDRTSREANMPLVIQR